MLVFLLLLLVAGATAEERTVSITGKLGCFTPAGKWIAMPEAIVTLWEEDWGALDDHDELNRTTVDAQGQFNLTGTHSETTSGVRFFISAHVLCNGVPGVKGLWKGQCKDKIMEERCKPQEVTGYKFMKTGDAFFNHLFEYNPDGEENIKSEYTLDCAIGFKSGKETMDGLTCTGGLCKAGRCGHERSMGPTTIEHPGGKRR